MKRHNGLEMCIVMCCAYRLHGKRYQLLLSVQKELCLLVSVSLKASRGRWFVIIIPRPTAEAKVKLCVLSLTFPSAVVLSFSEELDFFFFMPIQIFHSTFVQPRCFFKAKHKCFLDSNYLTIITASIRTRVCKFNTVSLLVLFSVF